MTKLVIVESPTKVKKIQQFLPDGFVVDSCVGHIRDLPSNKAEIPAAIKDQPWADFGVDVTHDFTPYYVTIRGKNKVIQQLKKRLKDADELYLATDEDREGESISWHLVEALNPKVPVKRMVFNEITKKAVLDALDHTRPIDMDLVQAQETRRILDRLYGYSLSPLLWKKIGGNLSAGRVQSVAVRLVVERERQRRAFVPGTYWDLTAHLDHGGAFDARLTALHGTRVATGKDFDKETGRIKEGLDVVLVDETQAKALRTRLRDAVWMVDAVEHQERSSRPKPPFITSTLQQEANNRLNMSARDTMRIAQRLYENGFITYMRTDSTALSDEALEGARQAVVQEFGSRYYGGRRDYADKKANRAQEAHEAIRPAGEHFIHPDRSGLSGREKALYDLVWRRTLASQMTDEEYRITTVTLEADDATFTATGKEVLSPGFRLAWPASGQEDTRLPPLSPGDSPTCKGIEADGHETRPPARFTEATLIQELEKEGIGRPSTYASILDTIQQRGYVRRKGKALVPTFTAFAVTQLLERHFPRLVDTRFTADMEKTLDEIASGDAAWVPFLHAFYHGEEGLQATIARHMEHLDSKEVRCLDLGLSYPVCIGRFGPYVEAEVDGKRITVTIPDDVTPDELDDALVERLVRQRVEDPPSLGTDPESGEEVYLLEGRFGPYVQLGTPEGKRKPSRASLPKGMKPEDVDLEEALFLLSLPRVLGPHPDGGDVVAGLGRYGPYVAHRPPGGAKADYRSLHDAAALKRITLQEALQLLARPKGGRRGSTLIRDLGLHPDDGAPVQLMEGRYGRFVRHGKNNAKLPKGIDPDTLDMDAALALLKEKQAKDGRRRR